jgi:hypothetical protein
MTWPRAAAGLTAPVLAAMRAARRGPSPVLSAPAAYFASEQLRRDLGARRPSLPPAAAALPAPDGARGDATR